MGLVGQYAKSAYLRRCPLRGTTSPKVRKLNKRIMELYFFSSSCWTRTTSISPSEAITAQVVAGNRSAACENDPSPINKRRLPLPDHIPNHISGEDVLQTAMVRYPESRQSQSVVMMATKGEKRIRASLSRPPGVTLNLSSAQAQSTRPGSFYSCA